MAQNIEGIITRNAPVSRLQKMGLICEAIRPFDHIVALRTAGVGTMILSITLFAQAHVPPKSGKETLWIIGTEAVAAVFGLASINCGKVRKAAKTVVRAVLDDEITSKEDVRNYYEYLHTELDLRDRFKGLRIDMAKGNRFGIHFAQEFLPSYIEDYESARKNTPITNGDKLRSDIQRYKERGIGAFYAY